jgi:hypothetical protein
MSCHGSLKEPADSAHFELRFFSPFREDKMEGIFLKGRKNLLTSLGPCVIKKVSIEAWLKQAP